jgi:hypothetical protein
VLDFSWSFLGAPGRAYLLQRGLRHHLSKSEVRLDLVVFSSQPIELHVAKAKVHLWALSDFLFLVIKLWGAKQIKDIQRLYVNNR